MSTLFTILSIGLFIAFIGYLIYDALHAPDLPPSDDPDLPAYDPQEPTL